MKIINKKGLTLVELVITIALIGLIAVVFMPLFLLSAKTNTQSEDKLTATYLGKDAMEMVYRISQKTKFEELKLDSFDSGYESLGDNLYSKKITGTDHDGTITIKLSEAKLETVNNKDGAITVKPSEAGTKTNLIKVIVTVKDIQNKEEIKYETLYTWIGRGI